jgi:hypothetical protein
MDGVFDPNTWGPHYWFTLMTVAMTYPDTPNDVTRRKYYDFIQNLPLFIPNAEISGKFSHMLDKYPITPYLNCRESFLRWVVFVHNRVNYSLGKEEITFEAAMETYLAEYRPKPVYLTDKIRIRKYWLFGGFALACVAIILIYGTK